MNGDSKLLRVYDHDGSERTECYISRDSQLRRAVDEDRSNESERKPDTILETHEGTGAYL